MPLPSDPKALQLSKDLLSGFDKVSGGEHPGFRPTHAKGIMLTGIFRPSKEAASITRAPHMNSETQVTARFSDFGGIPAIPDNSADAAPRGFAIRFHLGEHAHTDLVAHSVDNFPTRTAEEFGDFLKAVAATTPDQPHPNAIEQFLGSHPASMAFVITPKPTPTSFARESYFAVSAFKFTSSDGKSRYGRYRLVPVAGSEYLDANATSKKTPNFLFDELHQRIASGPVKFKIVVQLAEEGDPTDDATARWPESRPQFTLGEIVLNHIVAAEDADARRVIFDPIPRVDGIEPSADPLFNPRADLYLLSGRRRRSADEEGAKAKAS